MFLVSSLLSQAIIILLILMSAYTWAIIYIKWRRFRKISKQNLKVKEIANSRRAIETLNLSLTPPDNPFVRIIEAMKSECPLEQTTDNQGRKVSCRVIPSTDILKERLNSEIELILGFEESKIDFLAATSSVAPFLGLLGTVLGITESFWEIGKQSTANIAVVAPGLAEALITTIVGLVVAIPASVGFNVFRGNLRDLAVDLEHFTSNFMTKLLKESRI